MSSTEITSHNRAFSQLIDFSQMKNDIPTPNLKIWKVVFFIWRIALKGWVSFFHGFVCTVGGCFLHILLWVKLPGAPTADLTMSPPTSIAAAHLCRAATMAVRAAALHHRPPAWADLMKSAILTYSICFALVTFLPTVIAKWI